MKNLIFNLLILKFSIIIQFIFKKIQKIELFNEKYSIFYEYIIKIYFVFRSDFS